MSNHFNATANFPEDRITDQLIRSLAQDDDWYAPNFDETIDDDYDDLRNSIYAAPYGHRVWLSAD